MYPTSDDLCPNCGHDESEYDENDIIVCSSCGNPWVADTDPSHASGKKILKVKTDRVDPKRDPGKTPRYPNNPFRSI